MSVTEGVKSACVPCSAGHFGASSTFLNEAIRFEKDGLTSPQVLDDIGGAIGEFNALERIDLTPAKIEMLPDWEKEMAKATSTKSRELRHRLENVQSMEELRSIAAETENYYKWLNREWLSKRLEECPTCQIKATEPETEKHDYSEYGKSVSEARQALIEEIRQARSK